jgi:outer membrane immunogenic protein
MSVKLLTGASLAALFLTLCSAQAADLSPPAVSAAAVPAHIYNWGGYYVGGQLGYASGRTDHASIFGVFNDFDIDGIVGGVHAGYNHQMGQWVVGLEGDIEFAGLDGDVPGALATVDRLESQWIGSVRGRIGYAFDRVLIYTTGGVAFGGFEASTSVPFFGVTVSDKNVHTGWTIGAGAEMAITSHVTARVEYRYTDFNEQDYAIFAGTDRDKPDFHAVRIGASYKF